MFKFFMRHKFVALLFLVGGFLVGGLNIPLGMKSAVGAVGSVVGGICFVYRIRDEIIAEVLKDLRKEK